MARDWHGNDDALWSYFSTDVKGMRAKEASPHPSKALLLNTGIQM